MGLAHVNAFAVNFNVFFSADIGLPCALQEQVADVVNHIVCAYLFYPFNNFQAVANPLDQRAGSGLCVFGLQAGVFGLHSNAAAVEGGIGGGDAGLVIND